MQVLEDDDRGGRAAEARQQLREVVECELAPHLKPLAVLLAHVGREAEEPAECRREVWSSHVDRRQAGDELVADRLGIVVVRDLEPIGEDVADQAERALDGVRQAAALEPPHPDRRLGLDPVPILEEKARLADARLAADDDDARFAALGRRPVRLHDPRQVRAPADHPCLEALEAARPDAKRPRPQAIDAVGADRFLPTLQLEVADVRDVEHAAYLVVRRAADQHRPRLGVRLEARGDVHGVARRPELLRHADVTQVDEPGVDSDAELQRARAHPVGLERLHRLEHRDACAHGLLRVVLERVLAAPERHHAVAEVLDDAPSVLDDDAPELAPEPVDETADPLGIELLDERRVALDVREHHGDLPAPRALRRRQLGEALAHGAERRVDDLVPELRAPLLERADRLLEALDLVLAAVHARSLRRCSRSTLRRRGLESRG